MAIAVQNVAFHRGTGSMLSWPVTITAGDDRAFVAVAHTRGNPGASTVSAAIFAPQGGGDPVATLTRVIDVHTEAIVRTALFELREDDFPADGTYDLEIHTFGAFQIALAAAQLNGVDQTEPTIIDGHGQRDTQTTITLGSQRPLVVVPRDGSLLVDAVSGDNPPSVLSPLGLSRDFFFSQVQSPLSVAAAQTLVDTDQSPVDLGWQYAGAMNRICMAYALYQPAGGIPPSAPRQANTIILGTFA